MDSNKPRVVKDFEKLDIAIQEQVKLAYPEGFIQNLITYMDKEGHKVSALPFEAADKYYLIRMSRQVAIDLIEDDDDYDDDGSLKKDIRMDLEDKYGDQDILEEMADMDSDDDDDDM